MARSACAKCGWRAFEIKNVEPRGSRYELNFVQCASYGVPVGVLEFDNLGKIVIDIDLCPIRPT